MTHMRLCWTFDPKRQGLLHNQQAVRHALLVKTYRTMLSDQLLHRLSCHRLRDLSPAFLCTLLMPRVLHFVVVTCMLSTQYSPCSLRVSGK
jgi:hypothetical protein